MKLGLRPTKVHEVGWWLALSACLLLLYVTFLQLGFAPADSKGLSLFGLFVILAIGFFMYRRWLNSRWDRRFEGLTLEQQMAELEKAFDEQIGTGVVTRAELEDMRVRARNAFERKQQEASVGTSLFNWSAHEDTQQQAAAARRMLRAGGLQR
jgi:hypothetical protein